MIKKGGILRAFFLALFLMIPISVFALTFPTSPFFSYRPGYGFKLISNLSNTIQVDTGIEFTDNFSKSGIFYYIWNISLEFEHKKLNYRLKFRVDRDGNLYLEEFNDGLFLQTEFSDDAVLSVKPVLDHTFSVSDSISFTFKRIVPKLKVRDNVYKNVFEAVLKIGSKKILLYFVKNAGLIGVKTETETFK